MKILYNSLWMVLEKIILSVAMLAINIYVARYLGPTGFGVITYIITWLSLAVVASNFGTNTIIFQKVSANPKSARSIVSYALFLRFFIYAGISLIIYNYLYYTSGENNRTLYMLLAVSFLFQSVDCYSWYFDAKLKSKYNSIINVSALAIALVIRYLVVYFSLSIEWLALPYLVNFAISFLLKKYFFDKAECLPNDNFNVIKKIKVAKRYLPALLCLGFPLFLSEMSILIYTRMSNLYLEYFDGVEAVGHYNATYTISVAWTVIPIALITSLFTLIYNEKDNGTQIKLGSGLIVMCMFIGILISVISVTYGKYFILFLYGEEYEASASIFPYLMISSIFSLIGVISYRMIIAKNGYKYIAKKMLFMGVVSLPLNLWLVKSYGLLGAAYSALIIELISATIANYFFKKGSIAAMHFIALSSPLKILKLTLIKARLIK